MSFLSRIFKGRQEREAYLPLYNAIVNVGRDPAWYMEGQVPDTIDGRFDMIAAVLALTLLRLEAEEARTRSASVFITEVFIDDMDGSVRQLGIGDMMVGKHIGKMMGALGGRITALRTEIEQGGDFTLPVARNIFRESPPSREAVAFVAARLRDLHARLAATPLEAILKGEFPGA